MAFELVKGDITIRADSEQEAERAYRWLESTGTPASPPGVTDEVVTGMKSPLLQMVPIPALITGPPDAVTDPSTIPGLSGPPSGEQPVEQKSRGLFLPTPIPETPPAKLVSLNPPESQMIPVRKMLLEVVEVLLEFPEGISSRGISTLTGVTQSKVGHRLTRLKKMGLAELIKGSIDWRATQLARRSKLIGS